MLVAGAKTAQAASNRHRVVQDFRRRAVTWPTWARTMAAEKSSRLFAGRYLRLPTCQGTVVCHTGKNKILFHVFVEKIVVVGKKYGKPLYRFIITSPVSPYD